MIARVYVPATSGRLETIDLETTDPDTPWDTVRLRRPADLVAGERYIVFITPRAQGPEVEILGYAEGMVKIELERLEAELAGDRAWRRLQ